MDGLCQKHAVDAARTGPGNDVWQYPQAQGVLRLDMAQKIEINRLDVVAGRSGVAVIGAAGAGQVPQFLGDAVHVDRQADPAVAHQREPQFLLPHDSSMPANATLRQCG